METRKSVRLLILIFCVMSVLFYSLYRKESISKSYLTEEFVSGAVLNLRNSGVSLSPSVVDRAIPEKDIFTFDIESDDVHHNNVANAIIDCLFGGTATMTSFDVPEGVSVGIYENRNGTVELGRIVFSKTDLSFDFSVNGVNINGVDSAIINDQLDVVTEEQKIAVDTIISKMTQSKSLGYRISGCSSNDEYVILTVVQMVEGYDIYDVYMNFVFADNEIVDISGSWITSSPKAQYHNKLVDGVNVLYKLDFDEVSAVTGERIVYFLRKTDTNKFFVIPGWEISYFDNYGHQETVFFDAL